MAIALNDSCQLKRQMAIPYIDDENALAEIALGDSWYWTRHIALMKIKDTHILDKIVLNEDKKGAELYISDAGEIPFKMIKRYYVSKHDAREGMNRIYNEFATVKRTESSV